MWGLFAESHHDAAGFSGPHFIDGGVNVTQFEGIGDEAIEVEVAGFGELDVSGDFDIGLGATAMGTGEDFSKVEGEGMEGVEFPLGSRRF